MTDDPPARLLTALHDLARLPETRDFIEGARAALDACHVGAYPNASSADTGPAPVRTTE